jgi:DNA-binding GntR family transcriptional regulator
MNDISFNLISRANPLIESVVEQISESIIAGNLQPGDRLVEERIGQQLGVSRGPVREAFRRLEQLGLIEKIPYRGAFVANLTEKDIRELHDLRELLEILAIRLISQKSDQADITRLEEHLNKMRQAARENKRSEMVKLDADFHDNLIELSRHKLLQDIWAVMRVRFRRYLLLKPKRLYQNLDEAIHLHEPIVAAIKAGNGELAETELLNHIRAAGKSIKIG